jgi:hypothetical protein
VGAGGVCQQRESVLLLLAAFTIYTNLGERMNQVIPTNNQ